MSAAPRVDVTLVGAGGEYMDSAVVVEWLVGPGTAVRNGDVLAVVETAKAATEITAPADGVVSEVLARRGEEVGVGAVLARIATGEADPSVGPASSAIPMHDEGTKGDSGSPQQANGLTRRWPRAFATPLAKRIAVERGIDIAGLEGSGPRGRIVRADVERAGKSVEAPKPAAGEGYRRAMAAHMAKAATIPAFSVAVDVDGTALFTARKAIKERGGRASLNDLVLSAVARVLRRHRRVNARWDGAGVSFNEDVNLGVAVATDLGLVVPVIHRADALEPEEFAQRVAELRVKAESQRLAPGDIAGATFTVSNLGAFGVSAFTAALNPPAAAILAVPAFQGVTIFDDGRLETRPVARFALTADHRVLDGADAARFLNDLKAQLEGSAK